MLPHFRQSFRELFRSRLVVLCGRPSRVAGERRAASVVCCVAAPTSESILRSSSTFPMGIVLALTGSSTMPRQAARSPR